MDKINPDSSRTNNPPATSAPLDIILPDVVSSGQDEIAGLSGRVLLNTSMAASLDANNTLATNAWSPGYDVMVDAILPTCIENPQFKGNMPSEFQHSNQWGVLQPVPRGTRLHRSLDVTGRLVEFPNSNQQGIMSSTNARQDASQLISSQWPQVDQIILGHASQLTSSINPQLQSTLMSSTNVMQNSSQLTSSRRAQVGRSNQPTDSRYLRGGNTPSGFYDHNHGRTMVGHHNQANVNRIDGSLLSSGFGGNTAIGQSFGYRGGIHPTNLRPSTFPSVDWQTPPVHGHNYLQTGPTYYHVPSMPNPSAGFQTAFHNNRLAVTPSNNTDYMMVSPLDEAPQNANFGDHFGPAGNSHGARIPGHTTSNQGMEASHSDNQFPFGNLQGPPSQTSNRGGLATSSHYIPKQKNHHNMSMPSLLPQQQQPYTPIHQTSATGLQRSPSHTSHPGGLATGSQYVPRQTHHNKLMPPSFQQQQQPYTPTHQTSATGLQRPPSHTSHPGGLASQTVPRQTHHRMTMPPSFQQQQPYTPTHARGQGYPSMAPGSHQKSGIRLQRPPSHTTSHDLPQQKHHSMLKPSPSQQQPPDEPLHIKGPTYPDIFSYHPEPVGKRCGVCNHDLAFEPQGSNAASGLFPAAAVLPCGHCYHESCLKFAFDLEEEPYDCPPCIHCPKS